MLRLRLCVGDIASWRGVDCVAVSTNRTLQGNENPTYWRFAGRKSVNGAVRSVGGPELAEACKAQALRRHCEVGEAVVTPAFGDLARRGCRHVVHVMVPDGLQIHGGGTDRHVQRMALPVMRQSFSAVLDAAADVGALSAAMPPNLGWNEAGSLPKVALTSFKALAWYAGGEMGGTTNTWIKGKTVLVLGGSGGTGTAGIQLAKAMGAAKVITTAGAGNAAYCMALGADEVYFKLRLAPCLLQNDPVSRCFTERFLQFSGLRLSLAELVGPCCGCRRE